MITKDVAGQPKNRRCRFTGMPRWGWDFKMVVDPYGDSTNFHNELRRFNEKAGEDWLAAYTPKNEEFKAKYATLSDEEIALWKFNRYIKDYLRTIKVG
jgi:hypothetical protein